jgi:putative cardiolipin synthase
VGQAVPAVSKQFDLYWNSASAYPAGAFVGPAGADATARLLEALDANRRARRAADYIEAVRNTPLVRDIIDRRLQFEWAPARLVYDDPAKTLDTEGRVEWLMFPELLRLTGAPARSLDLVSPYFVPGDAGTAALAALAARGVTVRILTNSLAASDVGAVHAGYAKRRHALLRAGVQLFELKPHAAPPADDAKLGSSSSSGLHAKTFAVDRERIFVGSFNFDPRSARLNTELGLLIDSPELARALAHAFDATIPQLAYEVRLTAGGKGLEWIERTPSGELRHDGEPGASAWRRLGVQFMSILPIEWLL